MIYVQVLQKLPRLCCATFGILLCSFIYNPEAHACGNFDLVCHFTESVASGAGQGVSAGLRPLVKNVMEQEAPKLIEDLKFAVDHNIMTGKQAGEELTAYAAALFQHVANSVILNSKYQVEDLTTFAKNQALDVEGRIFKDIDRVIAQIHCQELSLSRLTQQQEGIFNADVNHWLNTFRIFQSRKDKVKDDCEEKFGLPKGLSPSHIDLPTDFRIWRCVRLNYVTESDSAVAMQLAYDDVVVHEKSDMCVLKDNPAPLREMTKEWISDTASETAWDSAVSGH